MKQLLTITLTFMTLWAVGQSKKENPFNSISAQIQSDTSYRVIDTTYSVSNGGMECFKAIKATYKQMGNAYQVTYKYQIDKAGYWQFYSVFVERYQHPVFGIPGTGGWILTTPNNGIPLSHF